MNAKPIFLIAFTFLLANCIATETIPNVDEPREGVKVVSGKIVSVNPSKKILKIIAEDTPIYIIT
jgi:hypothetical protein